MVTVLVPFEKEKVDEKEQELLDRDLDKMMGEPLRAACKAHPHLRKYLSMIPISRYGIPQYCPKLEKQMADAKEPNFIYPIIGNLFAHILVDFNNPINTYIPIDPTMTMDVTKQFLEVEKRCIEFGDRLPEFNIYADHENQLMSYVDMLTTTTPHKESPSWLDRLTKRRKNQDQLSKVYTSPEDLEVIKYVFIRDKIGLGALEPVILDHYIEDISCCGVGPVYLEHKIFGSLKCIITFITMDELDEFVLRMAEQMKKTLNYTNAIADATLPSGARVNIVYGRDVSKQGSNFTIRQFSQVPLSIFELVDFGTINYMMLAYLAMMVGGGMNIFVAGESASGKTSLLNALTTFIHPNAKIITIEDTPELQVPHENWIREVVQSTRANDTSGAVTMFDLLKAALRQRPNEIMVGEIRGPEGNVAFQAMQTGHSVMTTFHAASVEKLIQRLTSSPILVPKTYIDNLNVAILMSSVKLPNGRTGRRITSINEIVGFDSATQSFTIVEAFQWDEGTDKFTFSGNMSSHLLEHKIAPRLGFAGKNISKVYAEVTRRARILEKLHKEQGVTGFYKVLEVLGKAQREGLF